MSSRLTQSGEYEAATRFLEPGLDGDAAPIPVDRHRVVAWSTVAVEVPNHVERAAASIAQGLHRESLAFCETPEKPGSFAESGASGGPVMATVHAGTLMAIAIDVN